MQGVNRNQIDRAKQVDIISYLQRHEPNNIRRIGNAFYLKDHGSLEISNGLWNWHSRGIGGRNIVDYLIKVRGFSFVDAVRHLTGGDVSCAAVVPNTKAQTERKQFTLPPRNGDNERVIAYLKYRGIDEQTILGCISNGSLYESAKWHNAVFIGRDSSGKARYASMRGTKGDFKRDADGSDKRFGFVLPPKSGNGCDAVAVFESPIDAMSHQTLYPEFDGIWRLSLGCTSLAALENFLQRHGEVRSVIASTDNDKAGNIAAEKIATLPNITATRTIPPIGKDWNDTLKSKGNEADTMEDVRKDIRFIDRSYKTLFTIKDGDSIKITVGNDGRVLERKCRFIDETHLTVGGETFHICELAERMERAGNKVEPAANQRRAIDILAAKHGEELQAAEVPMSETAIRKLVGGKYAVSPLNDESCQSRCALVRGLRGIAVCGIDGGTLTSIHPYWAQKYKHELSPAEPAKKPSLLGSLEEAKAIAAERSAAVSSGNIARKRCGAELS